MRTFTSFHDDRADVVRSFIYIGQQLDHLTEEDVQEQPQAKAAVNLLTGIASKMGEAGQAAKDFVAKIGKMKKELIVPFCRSKLMAVSSSFQKVYDSVRSKVGVNEGLLGAFKKGVQFGIEKILTPVLSALYHSITATVKHVIGNIVDAGSEMGVQGWLGMICATALTVALWPVFAAITGGTGVWAVGGAGMGIWLIFLLMAWFKVNVIGRSLAAVEGVHPPTI